MTKLWFLRRLDLFEGMSDIEMERLGSLLRMRSCRTGQDVVVRPSGDRIYVVKSGRVRLLQGDVAVGVLGPGQLFGTSALFGATITNQRVVAVDDVIICDAPAAQFLGAMAIHPRLAAKVALILARQLFELEQAVVRSATDPASARLAELLLRVAKGQNGAPVVAGMSEADLASMIGTSRETVSRFVAEWERKGIVRKRPRFIELADEAALRQIAG